MTTTNLVNMAFHNGLIHSIVLSVIKLKNKKQPEL